MPELSDTFKVLLSITMRYWSPGEKRATMHA
jgi:hypothetical protein